ncbi:MAG: TraB/GumN family protein [Sphaerochaetaceae bacterium]
MIDEKLGGTTRRITFDNGRRITLVGTAHVSKESVNEVRQVIEDVQPDRICLELDDGRYKSKTEQKDWSNTDIRKVFKEHRGFLMLANMALAGYQKRMGDETGSAPGTEILSAAEIAQEKGIPFSLCDREIQITFKRAWRKSSLWNKGKLMGSLLGAVFSNEKVSTEELEKLKQGDTMQSMMQEMAKELPQVKSVLIDERDRYLATSIYQSEGNNIVAVIGAGHQEGIIKNLKALDEGSQRMDLSDITKVPPPSKAGKIVGFIIPAAIIAMIVMGFVNAGWDKGVQMFLYWVEVNAIFTGIFSLIAWAHPLNIICSMAAAPFTSLNPTIGVGIVSGILEAEFRKPKVKDFENLNEDATKFKRWYSNRILHALWVFLLSSVGSTIGTFVGFPVLIKLLY